ncbi:adenylyltransferase/cytidyltransferase family protein [Phytoactinopolyspora limicola]|uniref:adenylyltransferase/cytidyltransferase family protein n=1 Tax=Phytoactinopolyspora limicola TaxID=2715536 RepID=UPI00140E2193
MTPRVGYVPGVFDMFHIGHLNILRQAKARCDYLVAGVVTDEVVEEVKNHSPVVPYDERVQIVSSIRYVDEVVPDTSSDKTIAWRARQFDLIFKGDDWRGTAKGERLERAMAELGVEVVYFPYTLRTSSTLLRTYLATVTGGGS